MPKDYEIGYGKPPRKNQWPKGQSGNPSGKPKGAKGPKPLLQYFAEVLSDEVEVTIAGKKQKIPIGKAMAMSLLTATMSAPPKAKMEIIASLHKLGVPGLQAVMIEEQDCEPDADVTEEDRRLLESARRMLSEMDSE